jgi:hypothetical protein
MCKWAGTNLRMVLISQPQREFRSRVRVFGGRVDHQNATLCGVGNVDVPHPNRSTSHHP